MGKISLGKKSLSLTRLNCKIEDFSGEILDLVEAKSKGSLYTKFVEKFLTYIPVDYRSKDQIRFLGDFTDEAFKFFQARPKGDRKIEISQTTFNQTPSLTILIITDNKPFIIDSINCLLNDNGLKPLFTFHPVICAKRDEEGNLTDIPDKNEDGIRESLVFIEILGNFDQKIIKHLTKEVEKIIDLVSDTYSSWQNLLNKLIDITTDIMHNKAVYENKGLPFEEALDFLNWLQKNNFTFLGMVDYDVKTKKIKDEQGVKEIWAKNKEEIETIVDYSCSQLYQDKLVMLGKLNKISPVHRKSLIDYILVKHLDDEGNYISGTLIFGLYGSAIYYQSIKSVPILREKMNYVLDESDFPPNGYFAKKLKVIIESLPREVLIQIDEADLYCMCLHMLSSMRSRNLKLFIQQYWSNSFINIIMFMPRERLTPDAHKELNHFIAEKFGCEIIFDNITVVAQDFAHLFLTLAIKESSQLEFSSEEIEKALVKITTNWTESLGMQLSAAYGEYEGNLMLKEIDPALPTEYKHKFSAEEALEDIKHLHSASNLKKTVHILNNGNDGYLYLKIYNPETPLTLSDTLPAIENLGFTAIEERSFAVKPFSDVKASWLYEFKLQSPIEVADFNVLKQSVEGALDKMSLGVLISDSLSKLLVMASFDWPKVKLMKALTRYLHQTGFNYGKGYVQQTLIKHHNFTKMLVELFYALFDPKHRSGTKAAEIEDNIAAYLDKVESSAEDKVMRHMHLIIKAIVRTNFFQDISGEVKEYISFKFQSKRVPDLPLPLPYAEIYVYSHEFEGIHLRGGKVARGGLRWSDRGEDYRTEVLGLMKAQMAKNSVIVPVGSKGGFYVHTQQGDMPRAEYMNKVVHCYKNFLRGLLDITDNLIDGEVVKPAKTVIYDGDDPYLVVAADKGTATFSDFANQVSAEYNFWLGDAFASGGSAGYDHKKMAITAKGGWISVQSHFKQLGIDIQQEPITVVGIGDMSGDVFGNGMLLSQCLKLVAAFNHMHIFVDPNPDTAQSYEERKRLFNLPGSKWSDYNPKLISKGGAIFERSQKILNISAEIQALFDINKDQVTPDELIKAMLKAKVDLIWNGGIGTYIKASMQNNVDIGDKANDTLRVDGREVRAKVVGEGGNLGVSQLGRIEYALNGGRINTDFIDNSAGVDCSDHEVNIKIAIDHAVKSGKINVNERNKILENMTNEVEKLVLNDNLVQNLAITICQNSPTMNLESFSQLMKELEKEQLLDRAVEFLPDSGELSRRALAKQSLTRPELAVLLSYSKMLADKQLSGASINNDPYCEKFLFEYFPPLMREKFKDVILHHPLKTDIIRTVITNKLINQLGGSIINDIRSETGSQICDVARTHILVCEIFNLDHLWQQVSDLPVNIDIKIKIEMFSDIAKIMRRGISWFIKNVKHPIDITPTIDKYQKQIELVTKISSALLVGEALTKFNSKIEKFVQNGIDKELAKSIATLDILVSAFDIIYIAELTGAKGEEVANLYFATGETLNIDWLRKACDSLIDESYWKRLSIQSIKDDLYDKQRRLIIEIIKINDEKVELKSWLKKYESLASIFTDFVQDIKNQESTNLNMLILATKKFELFLRKLN